MMSPLSSSSSEPLRLSRKAQGRISLSGKRVVRMNASSLEQERGDSGKLYLMSARILQPALYAIDKRAHHLADSLNQLLQSNAFHALGVATACFNVGGFDLLCETPGAAFVPTSRELDDLTGMRSWIKCAVLMAKYIGFYPIQW